MACRSPEAALELARYALKLPRIAFEGLMVFPNTAPNTAEFFGRALELFGRAGISLPVRSGGGTPALASLADFPMMTEHRAGTYVYNDVMMVHSGVAAWENCAMHVRATVVSRPTADRAVVDSGSKVLSSDQYYVEHYGRLVEYPEAFVRRFPKSTPSSICRAPRTARGSARSSASFPTIAARSAT